MCACNVINKEFIRGITRLETGESKVQVDDRPFSGVVAAGIVYRAILLNLTDINISTRLYVIAAVLA